ncbi:MAG: hypothetical protein EBX02_05525, partial [Betaproteobacteria bacterium]|nr:hypothetical protein [Betaproteobacteria bacterium]
MPSRVRLAIGRLRRYCLLPPPTARPWREDHCWVPESPGRRLPQAHALINRFGFNNHGLEAFVANVSRARKASRRDLVLGLNIGKNAATPMEHA